MYIQVQKVPTSYLNYYTVPGDLKYEKSVIVVQVRPLNGSKVVTLMEPQKDVDQDDFILPYRIDNYTNNFIATVHQVCCIRFCMLVNLLTMFLMYSLVRALH